MLLWLKGKGRREPDLSSVELGKETSCRKSLDKVQKATPPFQYTAIWLEAKEEKQHLKLFLRRAKPLKGN